MSFDIDDGVSIVNYNDNSTFETCTNTAVEEGRVDMLKVLDKGNIVC